MRISVPRPLNLFAVVILFLFACPSMGSPENVYPERYYQRVWCDGHNGRAEVTLPDRTRCDCVTKTHAVEVEFARNWHSSIGQALWYATQTEKRAGIVLIIKTGKDLKYWIKLNALVSMYDLPIDLWMIKLFEQ